MGCVEVCGGIGVCVGEICGSSSPGAAAIQAFAAYRLASIRNRSTATVSGVALSPIVTMVSSMPAIPFSRARA